MSAVLTGYLLYGGLLALCLLLAVKPLGAYMARVYLGEPHWLVPLFGRVESGFYKLAGVDPRQAMTWRQYTAALIMLSAGAFLLVYVLAVSQGILPWNPRHLPGMRPDLAFNVAVSYVTNTDWQSYKGAAGISPLVATVGLGVQNFVSAAVGLCVMVVLTRGISGKERRDLGNFWADLVRGILYILLPLALVLAILLSSLGVVQSLHSKVSVPMLENAASPAQAIHLGPIASTTGAKLVTSGGGGWFDADSAHPFENPSALTGFVELFAMLLLPAALCYTFGVLVHDRRQGWALLAAMTLLFAPMAAFCVWQESKGNPVLATLGVDQTPGFIQSGGNMEGKEARFGIAASAIWAAATAASGNGATVSAHSSYTPLGGVVPLVLIQMGEVAFGGVGSGIYVMLMFVIVAVFMGGLMVGRSPEYLGKRIQSFEIRMVSVAILVPAATVLLGTALGVSVEAGRVGLMHDGAHGFTEMLYALSSATANNGSAFGGIESNSPFFNTLLGFAMLLGRYWVMLPMLAIAGSLAGKRALAIDANSLHTHTPLFVLLLCGSVVLVGVLTYIPALTLGPIVEALQLAEPRP